MADWDEDSPRLRKNLTSVLHKIRESATARAQPGIADMYAWHAETMAGLVVPDQKLTGKLRGSPGLENIGVASEATWAFHRLR